jgi:hypothetical protein
MTDQPRAAASTATPGGARRSTAGRVHNRQRPGLLRHLRHRRVQRAVVTLGPNLMCRADKCPHAYLFPADNSKNHPATTTATRSPSAKETGYLPLFHVIPFVFKVFFH